MTPHEFISKWRSSELKESAAAQSHFNDLCALLDIADPAALDEAVAEAYGWGDDWREAKLTDDEMLARLFRLNQERAEREEKD